MTTVLATNDQAIQIERVLINGDLSKLQPEERVSYYRMVCESVGLNPLTKPFEYITLNGKLTLYARKDATDQLRNIKTISILIVAREVVDDCYVVTSRAVMPSGRTDESIGAVPIGALKGEAKCNAMMKAETKSKRRVTLSISGLGMLDETEIESIPESRQKPPVELLDEPIPVEPPQKPPQKSAPLNKEKVGEPIQKGTTPSDGADPKELAKEAKRNLSVKPAELPVGCIPQAQANSLARLFKDALKPQLRADADQIRRAWLKKQGIVDGDGQPTGKAILKESFPQVRDALLQYAASLEQ